MKVTDYRIYGDVSREYNFVFISDLHGCANAPILKIIDDISPEAILVGGDFIHDINNYQSGLDFLRNESKKRPVYCSLGNHEFCFDEDMMPQIKRTGATVLNNIWVEYDEIKIGGLSSAVKKGARKDRKANARVPDIDFIRKFSSENGFKLLLCHHPEYFPKYIKEFDVDLTMSGHAHGGQWRIFNRGIFAPGQGIFPKYTAGLIEGRLIVSRGLGNPHLIPRINNKPEIINLVITKNP